MPDEIIWCPRCQADTDHTRITPQLAVCAVYGCGHEYRKGAKHKETTNMAYTKLDEQQLVELRENWAAVPDEEKNLAAKQSLATKFGVSLNTVNRKLKGDKPAAKSKPKAGKKSAAKKTKRAAADSPAPSHGVFYDAVGGIVDQRLEAGLSALRADLPALVAVELMKLMKP